MSDIIKQVYANEMTENGLSLLREKYPEDLVVDMTDDDVLKVGRKTRTERNKLVEAINRRRLDVTGDLKKYGDSLIERILNIYDVVVLPFEKEDKIRKEKAAKAAKELEELLNKERAQIKEIYGFVGMCRGENSKFIQGKIEAVDLIETDIFHKDVIHEAIETKKKTLADLSQLLSDTIVREKVEAEREELRIKQASADEKLRKAEEDQKITNRINALRMQTADFFGKSSTTIDAQLVTLSRFMVTEEEFGDRTSEASTALDLVISQLEMASESAKRIEYVEKVEADKKAQELEDKENARQVVEPDEEKEVSETVETATVDDIPIEQTPEESADKAMETKIALEMVIRGFLELCSISKGAVNDFGNLLIVDDPTLNAKALDNIRTRFTDYMAS